MYSWKKFSPRSSDLVFLWPVIVKVRNYPAVSHARYDSAEHSVAEIQVGLCCWALIAELTLFAASSVALFVADW